MRVCECVCESNKRKTFRDIWEIQLLTTKYATFLTNALTAAMHKSFYQQLPVLATSGFGQLSFWYCWISNRTHNKHTLAPRTAKLFKLCTNCSWQRWNARHAPCAKAFNLFTHCTQWVHSESVLAFRFLAKYLRIAVTRERERERNVQCLWCNLQFKVRACQKYVIQRGGFLLLLLLYFSLSFLAHKWNV